MFIKFHLENGKEEKLIFIKKSEITKVTVSIPRNTTWNKYPPTVTLCIIGYNETSGATDITHIYNSKEEAIEFAENLIKQITQ